MRVNIDLKVRVRSGSDPFVNVDVWVRLRVTLRVRIRPLGPKSLTLT